MGNTFVKAAFYNAMDYIKYLEGRRELKDAGAVEVKALITAYRCRSFGANGL